MTQSMQRVFAHTSTLIISTMIVSGAASAQSQKTVIVPLFEEDKQLASNRPVPDLRFVFEFTYSSFLPAGQAATDTLTNLQWQRQDDGVKRTWRAALDYCQSLQIANQFDWRLPTRKELLSIVSFGNNGLATHPAIFTGVKSDWYWTQTKNGDWALNAWAVSFAEGAMEIRPIDAGGFESYVRCVR